MDNLNSTGKDLPLIPGVRTIALLPGSRLPEVTHDLILLLQLINNLLLILLSRCSFGPL
ncbi:hypothetical protein [Microcoleus vaginatus]|uniref:hypothetical protein n=1 Tax=Microcoleus vaginatus TaxID=119532 RepID=UPI0032A423BC